MRALVKRVMPPAIWKLRGRLRFWRAQRRFGKRSRNMPMQELFAEIYRTNAWGNAPGEKFFSGAGSIADFAARYAAWVNRFVAEHHLRRIVDLGCGDFRVGRLLETSGGVHYTGLDIVPDVIRYNQEHFGSANVSFRCANILEDELPEGDLCLIRQVLQHLSNDQVAAVLARCSQYRYVVITEDVYTGAAAAAPNLDKPHGWDTRTCSRSGLYLELPPFSLPASKVLDIRFSAESTLRTVLLHNSDTRDLPRSA